MLTNPVSFQNDASFNEWTKRFEDKAVEICESFDAKDVWDKAEVLKDKNTRQFGISSFRTAVISNSNQHKAQNEILSAFEEMFGDGPFLDLRGT